MTSQDALTLYKEPVSDSSAQGWGSMHMYPSTASLVGHGLLRELQIPSASEVHGFEREAVSMAEFPRELRQAVGYGEGP